MKGVNGCFVCSGDHRAKARHRSEEVTAAIDKRKGRYPTALLTVEELSNVVEMFAPGNEGNNVHKGDDTDEVKWVEDEDEDIQ